MINNVILIGTLLTKPEQVVLKDQVVSKWVKFTINVERPFKSKESNYEYDQILIKTWEQNLFDIRNILEEGAVLGIKGRIQSFSSTRNDYHYLEIIADRVVFIA